MSFDVKLTGLARSPAMAASAAAIAFFSTLHLAQPDFWHLRLKHASLASPHSLSSEAANLAVSSRNLELLCIAYLCETRPVSRREQEVGFT